jgi:glycogen debranching enzyme
MFSFRKLCLALFILPNLYAQSISDLVKTLPHIEGKQAYLASPFATTGDRAYLIGHQNGQFPDLGWHITGEMGGLWAHPIKLLDGFIVSLDGQDLIKAESFINFPFANQHRFQTKNLQILRTQFVPDGIAGCIIEFEIENKTNQAINTPFVFQAKSDLRPTWLADWIKIQDYDDQAFYQHGRWVFQDAKNPWFAMVGSNQHGIPGAAPIPYQSIGKGISKSMNHQLTVPANGKTHIQFYIAGSSKSLLDAANSYSKISQQPELLFKQKWSRLQALAQKSKISIPDKQIQEAYTWLQYNTDGLTRDVPGIGRGISAGLPDYPWWFGTDSEYALQGALAIGQKDLSLKSIDLIHKLSVKANKTGRIVHEVSTNGVVFNPGNMNETPQFASLVWTAYKWTGDKNLIKKYFPNIKKGLNWLFTENDKDQNGIPDGPGMMEIQGLHSEMIDVACYTQKALEDAAEMAKILGETKQANTYAAQAKRLKIQINERFWNEEFGSFADFLSKDVEAINLIKQAIVRADTLQKPWAVTELKQTQTYIETHPSNQARPFVVHHNWVVNSPMELGIADPEKAIKGLETAKKFTNPFGLFVTGIDRDASAGSDAGSFKAPKIFTYTGAVMTLPTGVMAVAENQYGRPDQSLDYIQKLARSFSYALPGSMYEVSPDFGMMTQAWNVFGFAVPIVEHFFGIKPRADLKEITIAPRMPSTWKEASIENVEIGDNRISVYYKQGQSPRVTQTKNWKIILK